MSLTSAMWLWYNISWPITSFSIWIEPCTSNTSLNIRYLISTMKEKWAIGCIRIQSIISVLTKRVILKKKKKSRLSTFLMFMTGVKTPCTVFKSFVFLLFHVFMYVCKQSESVLFTYSQISNISLCVSTYM